jgi:hypothetical protein
MKNGSENQSSEKLEISSMTSSWEPHLGVDVESMMQLTNWFSTNQSIQVPEVSVLQAKRLADGLGIYYRHGIWKQQITDKDVLNSSNDTILWFLLYCPPEGGVML